MYGKIHFQEFKLWPSCCKLYLYKLFTLKNQLNVFGPMTSNIPDHMEEQMYINKYPKYPENILGI